MRHFLYATLLVLAARPAWAADEPKPNALTGKEIADGWVLLFDGETTFGLKVEGEVKVADGALVLGGEKASSVQAACAFGDFELKLDYRFEEGKQRGQLRLDRASNGTVHDLPVLTAGLPVWHHGIIRVEGRNESADFKGGLDGKAKFGKKFAAPLGRTTVALQVPAEDKLSVRNLKLRPLGTASLFNGKDLIGWKKPSDGKAKFVVTRDGWLNVLSGPGDLQTEGQ